MIFFHVAGFCLLKQETKFYSLDGELKPGSTGHIDFSQSFRSMLKKGVKKMYFINLPH